MSKATVDDLVKAFSDFSENVEVINQALEYEGLTLVSVVCWHEGKRHTRFGSVEKDFNGSDLRNIEDYRIPTIAAIGKALCDVNSQGQSFNMPFYDYGFFSGYDILRGRHIPVHSPAQEAA